MFSTVKAAINYIEGRKTYLTFEAFGPILEKTKLPYQHLKFIHIAGTNGKGSCVDYIRCAMQASGYQVGTLTSPYLYVHNDRICINGEMISDSALLYLLNKWYDFIETHHLSMFEIDIIFSLDYFLSSQVDVVIMETGIGGRFDKTNYMMPILSIITTISIDHTDLLGNTIEAITYQKAGIIKVGVPVLIGKVGLKARTMIKEIAVQKGSDVIETKTIASQGIDCFNYQQYHQVKLRSKAYFQQENAATALMACEYLTRYFPNMTHHNIQLGIESSCWMGRMEEILPNVYIDGAHNLAAMKKLIESIQKLNPKSIHIIYAALKDKDNDQMIKYLKTKVTTLTLTTFHDPRIYDVTMYLQDAMFVEDYTQLIKTPEEGVVVFTGSLHFISDIKKRLKL